MAISKTSTANSNYSLTPPLNSSNPTGTSGLVGSGYELEVINGVLAVPDRITKPGVFTLGTVQTGTILQTDANN